MRRRLASLAALGLLILLPASASAKKHIVAPGDPGSSQYQEDVPTASGSRPVSTLQPNAVAPSSVLSTPVIKQLDRHGASGRDLVSVAAETAPPLLPSAHPRKSAPALAAKPASGTTTLLASAVVGGSGGGLGVFLPIVLAALLAAAIAVAVKRRRS
jgi:hypothetical protein